MAEKIVEQILDWPFLAFLILMFIGFRFHKEIAERLSSISELSILGKTKIILGTKEVKAAEIGEALTQAFQDLEGRVEQLEIEKSQADTEAVEEEEGVVPEGLKDMLWDRVYSLLNSEFWYARYVDTLAEKTATSPKLMYNFLKDRPDVDVFKDGHKWAASLRSRSIPK
ncbi:MAG: hypothetical protein ABJJ37_11785 [Roseibium sp.]